MVNDELEGIWKKAVVSYPGICLERIYEEIQSGKQVSRTGFESSGSKIEIYGVTAKQACSMFLLLSSGIRD
jgi:hypothetical protein